MTGVAVVDRVAVMGETAVPVRAIPEQVGTLRDCGWSVVATNAQAERWADANLRRQGYATYLPLCLVKRRDRAIKTLWHSVEVPLFGGYLFVWLSRADPWFPIRVTPGVRSLAVAGQRLQFARSGDVEALQAGEDARRVLVSGAVSWRPGEACRVAGGAFAGCEAVVAELRGSRAVVGLIAAGALSRVVLAVEQLERRQ